MIIRYNKRANPAPARWSHNTLIEIVWTVVPVLILMVIAIFSFRLLFAYHDMPKPDLTVKATGNQWYWAYEYPDQKIAEYHLDACCREDEAKAKGVPYRLAADNPMVVPVNKVVRVLVTGADVIHAFAVPAFGIKIDAIPGRVNETWFKAEKIGTYYGQCSELCGVDHAFMPIEVKVVSQADFDAWVAAKAPKPAPRRPPPAAPAAAAAAGRAAAAAAPAPPPPRPSLRPRRTAPADRVRAAALSSSRTESIDGPRRPPIARRTPTPTAPRRSRPQARLLHALVPVRPTTRTSAPSTSSSPSWRAWSAAPSPA